MIFFSPDKRVPFPAASSAGSQRAGLPSLQAMHKPHDGTKTKTTWSPTSRPFTPSPTFLITPEPSCPKTIGITLGLFPLMTDKSE